MGFKNANSSPGVWLALLLVLVAHTLALTTHLDKVVDEDLPKTEERRGNDSGFFQGTPSPRGEDIPIVLDKVEETVDDNKRTETEGGSGKSINATEMNSADVSLDETVQKASVDEIATTVKTTPSRTTLQELEPIPTTPTIDYEKHLTTSNEAEAIEKTVEESEVESASVRTNETGDAINEENRNEKILDSDVKPLASTPREFELYEEHENFEEHTNSEFAEGTTTPSTKFVGVDRQKIVEDSHKNTERFDTELDRSNAGSIDAISLVNDTNVNYHKHFENGTRRTVGNDTNGDGTVNSEHAPKHEVEIFKNVTHPSILRFSEDPSGDSMVDNTTPYYPNSRPKGRTISITGDNDLSSEEPKATNNTGVNEATSDTVMRIFPKKSVSTEKPTELKPYPYIKSESKISDEQLVTEIPKRTEESTEEISAFENTIGGKKLDEKIVVTEPESSVLVENSIQQFKPIHNKRSGNSSRVNSTFDTPVASTAWSLGTDGDLAANNEAEVTEEPVKIQVENGNRSQINNDVPQDHLSKSTTTVKSPLILSEVRENNIENIIGKTNGTNNETSSTPISKKLIDPDSGVSVRNLTQTTSGPGGSRVSNSTERTETVSNSFSTSNEIQSGHEDSSMVLNQFKVTEGSTERTLQPANFSTTSEVFANVPNATEKLSDEMETTVSLPVTISATTISTEESPSELPVFQSNVTKTVDENVANVTGIEKTSENHGSTRSFTEPIIGRATTVSYNFIELTTTEMDSTVSQSDVTSSEGSSTVASSINETSVATEPEESTTDGSIGQNETTVSREVETSSTEEPPPLTTPNVETTTTFNSEVEVTTIDDHLSSTDFPVSENTPTEVYTDTSSKSSIDDSIHGRIDATTAGQSEDPEKVTITETEPAIEETTTVSNIEVIVPLETTALPTTTTTTQSTTVQTTSTSEPPDFSASGDGVTLFVRMVIDGSWSDVCQVLKTLRQSLANLLTEYAEKRVYPRNIVLYQPQCTVETVPSANLTPVLLYVVDDNGDFDYSMTEALPSLHRQSSIVFSLPILSVEKLVQENPTESDNHAIAVVAVSSVAFICLVLLAGLLFIMRKRQTRFNYGERCRPVSLDAFRVDSVSAYNSVRRKGLNRASKRSYGNPAFEDSSVTPTHPLNFAGLSSFCNDLTAITEEFSGIPQVTARMDELPAGAEVKNRYANVAPLPETRVLLQKINNEPLTEYINASYVRGPKNATKYYIACQAPMESTVSDFWRMIWEQQSKVIIMLTDIVENGVEKCVEYIPPSEVTDCHRLYGDYQVTLKKREAKEKYAISTLHLKNLENNTYREVYHIWYLWPTNGVPSNGTGLIAVLLEARALQRGAPGPIVTHCSPGTGRTGTLIALDLGIRQYEITRTVDVPRVVYTIRRDRAGAVQTKEQYAFIYKALNLYAAKLAGGALESM